MEQPATINIQVHSSFKKPNNLKYLGGVKDYRLPYKYIAGEIK
jgi:hypothetical protein